MAGRDVCRPPYGAAAGLLRWAVENWGLVDGRAALAGFDPRAIPTRRFLNVVYVMILEDAEREAVMASIGVKGGHRKKFDRALDRAGGVERAPDGDVMAVIRMGMVGEP